VVDWYNITERQIMIETRKVPIEESGYSAGGVEGITQAAITSYAIDAKGNVIGVAGQEIQFCRLLAACQNGTITVSVPTRGFAVSLMLEDVASLINQVGYTHLND